MNFDYDILFEFLSEEDKKNFQVWDNVFLSGKYYLIPNSVQTIVANYRIFKDTFDRILISLDEYELKLKQKERNNKLNNLGIN